MEVIALELIASQLVEIAIEEVIEGIMMAKCCVWSKRKWVKIMQRIKKNEPERKQRVSMILESERRKSNNSEILDYANKIGEMENIKITNI
jgi:hypothetical protein